MKRQLLSLSAALAMWLELQQHYGQGGFLLYHKDTESGGGWQLPLDKNDNQQGGTWYPDSAHPDMVADDIRQPCCQSEHDLGTLAEFTTRTQRVLDARADEEEQSIIGLFDTAMTSRDCAAAMIDRCHKKQEGKK
jgi:hypothetical protein